MANNVIEIPIYAILMSPLLVYIHLYPPSNTRNADPDGLATFPLVFCHCIRLRQVLFLDFTRIFLRLVYIFTAEEISGNPSTFSLKLGFLSVKCDSFELEAWNNVASLEYGNIEPVWKERCSTGRVECLLFSVAFVV